LICGPNNKEERKAIPPIYTISYSCELENCKTYEIKVEPPEEMAAFLKTAKLIRHHEYQIKYIDYNHGVICPEYKAGDGEYVVVVPWFLVFGSPYPIQIHLYACEKYSTNISRGQRWAAEETRIKFKLKTFSHTTLGRAFKSLDRFQKRSLEGRFGRGVKFCKGVAKPSSLNSKTIDGAEFKAQEGNRRFPSVEDTAARRKAMSKFLRPFRKAAKKVSVEAAGRKFVKYFYGKTRRLLL